MKLPNWMTRRKRDSMMRYLDDVGAPGALTDYIHWLEKQVEELEEQHGPDFYTHKTVEQLAAEQGVGPVEDPSALQDDLFDDGAFDGFEKMIDELRHNQKGDLL